MDRSNGFWLGIWVLVVLGVLGVAAAVAVPLAISHRQNVDRDIYFAEHCKIVNQYTSTDSGQTLRQYQCQSK